MENTENNQENIATQKNRLSNSSQIAGAILIAGLFIALAILLKDSVPSRQIVETNNPNQISVENLPPLSSKDRILGNNFAKVTVIEYADFQCPFCGKFFKEVKKTVINDYIEKGKVKLVYRDFAFLGEESSNAALAARCAGDQNKFWEYHDFLFNHQNGENRGAFSIENLKSFAKEVGLEQKSFTECFDSGKYLNEIYSEKDAGGKAGVRGTPKGFILVNGKVVETIDGAESEAEVRSKIEQALK